MADAKPGVELGRAAQQVELGIAHDIAGVGLLVQHEVAQVVARKAERPVAWLGGQHPVEHEIAIGEESREFAREVARNAAQEIGIARREKRIELGPRGKAAAAERGLVGAEIDIAQTGAEGEAVAHLVPGIEPRGVFLQIAGQLVGAQGEVAAGGVGIDARIGQAEGRPRRAFEHKARHRAVAEVEGADDVVGRIEDNHLDLLPQRAAAVIGVRLDRQAAIVLPLRV